MQQSSDLFYTELPLNDLGLDELFDKDEHFTGVPADWHIVITDIKHSTQAVLGGQHEAVNFIATGSIVTVLNIASKMKVDVPFFFGGDGATFIVPPLIMDPVMQALSLYKKNTLANFDLEIRAGAVPVEKVYQDGHMLQISKHSRSSVFSIPVILGNGLNYAEKLIKGPDYLSMEYPHPEEDPDLTGMQCRWDRIAPPENQEEVIALLVIAREGAHQASIFRKVMQKIDEIYGGPMDRQPISVTRLRMNTSYNRLKTEVLAKFGRFRLLRSFRAMIATIMGVIFFRTNRGRQYLQQLVEMSDTLVLDGRINTVISGTVAQRLKLEESLNAMEAENEIFYGLHISKASIMSCYVRNMDNAHIHFVDGSEGGYTEAARVLKKKLSQGMTLR